MTVVRDMIEKAFSIGSVSREDFSIDTDNKEQIVFIGPDGTKRVLGCYPGSVRVSVFFIFLFFTIVVVVVVFYIHIYTSPRQTLFFVLFYSGRP